MLFHAGLQAIINRQTGGDALNVAGWRASRTARTTFWAAACFAFVMAVLPHPPEVPGDPNDKVEHVVAFATLAALGSFAYPRLALLRLLAGLSMFGALIEFVQAIPALQRDSDPKDWIADTLAVVIVLALIGWRRRSSSASPKAGGASLSRSRQAPSDGRKRDDLSPTPPQ